MAGRTTTELAPYALVRVAALPHPPPAPSAFRDALDAAVAAEVAASAPGLADALHDSAAGHSPDFHRRVVLPLRRDVHNGRSPRPALLAALDGLPDRVPGLASWLAARADLDAAHAAARAAWEPALAASRKRLAEVCGADAVRRAGVLTGPDLLHGLDRTAAGRGEPDRKARKAEPTVLRYALRATSKTSPLSWYTHVGWGVWGDGPWPDAEPVAHPEVNRLLTTRLLDALAPGLPHRLAPALRERDGRVVFRRDVPVDAGNRALVTREEEVDVPAAGPLRFVVGVVRAAGPGGLPPAAIADRLAAQLAVADAAGSARAYVARMRQIGLLVPVPPVHPQDPDQLGALDVPGVADLALATRSLATADPVARARTVADLAAGWAEVATRVGADLRDVPPVVEDVLLPEPVPVPRGAAPALADLTPLLALFDEQVLLRRLMRTRFVERFGVGGTASLADCSGALSVAWQDSMNTGAVGDPEVAAVVAARARLAGLVRGGVVTPDVLDAADALLPAWATRRPGSYSFFAQPTRDGRLVVNRVYTGFGKFTSRFLDRLPGARDAVTAQLVRHLGPGFAQFRPVRGFNANVHPLLGAHEVGEDARWVDLPAESLSVRHDPEADEVRVVRDGEPLDVLYLGFLVPLVFPDRLIPLYSDLACGWVDLTALRESVVVDGVTARGRLTYGDVVLARRSWDFAHVPDLGEGDAVVPAVTRLRARLGLPEHVFAGPDIGPASPEVYRRTLVSAKPQYADLGDPLHLRALPRLLARFPDGLRLTEALPVPGLDSPGGRVLELVAETYWRTS
ncbi:lantibiotic dehydratase [Saccharothrix obliqua]|uniref:lantibiotic dehydratase n=1 Tax=Saccharothrix obliqua TaxID=2861747 RepID=UPI001C5E5EC3|nr:lantibiotic dehydratase [Saccharothrix obliqua]MBW4717788.1 lantibiotic dehydratase family protein [Saccharothrix obliqua]